VDRTYEVGAGYRDDDDLDDVGVEFEVDRRAADATGRQGDLRATMTVTVVAIDSVGNLEVSGEQRIVLNGKEQLIAVEGVVRPIDVMANNTVLSNRLAQARIEYDGYAVNDDGEKRNWLYRTLSRIGLI
jgi:flagellar L-ring protein precursor FlgH